MVTLEQARAEAVFSVGVHDPNQTLADKNILCGSSAGITKTETIIGAADRETREEIIPATLANADFEGGVVQAQLIFGLWHLSTCSGHQQCIRMLVYEFVTTWPV